MIKSKEEKENAFRAFMEKMTIAEKSIEEQGYYSEEEVEGELVNT